MKVYLNKPGEDWVVDRFRNEFYKFNKNLTTKFIANSDIVWIIAPWVWKRLPKSYLQRNKVICTYHHLDLNNFSKENQDDFYNLDQYVDEYHVISKPTRKQVEKFTNKNITVIPFWINQNIFFKIDNKDKLRAKFGFDKSDFLVGSFQRDTEGKDLISPKLVKGPDIFLKKIKELRSENENLKIVLTGKRRQYMISKLKELDIDFKYYQMADFKMLNKLYNILDLYIVSSRVEGGPQAILESAITKTPIVSTNVGIASDILHENSIFNENEKLGSPNVDYAYKNASLYQIPQGFKNFRDFFNDLH